MFSKFQKKLDPKSIEEIRSKIEAASKNENQEEVLNLIQPLLKSQAKQKMVALELVDIIREGHFSTQQALDIFLQVHNSHTDDKEVVCDIGLAIEKARDIDDLNAPPPDSNFFEIIVEKLQNLSKEHTGSEEEALYLEGLSCAARLCSRQYDDLAETSYSRLVSLLPNVSWTHFNQGLYFKTRGKFKQGVLANQRAVENAKDPGQAYFWNLGICATGAKEGATALRIWKHLGQNIEMGRFDLPEGKYPSCKVKLSEHPLAERSVENDYPGHEETIWIERLSPCHGIIRSVLYEDLGVNYGDVILFDGAPITYHLYGDEKIAVFPHLATLRKNKYQFFDFRSTQAKSGVLNALSGSLKQDAVVYSHSENFQILCSTCWNDPSIQHDHHKQEEKLIVAGRIAAPPNMNPQDLLEQLDLLLSD